ncbi:MAG: hypothetical protein ABR567_08630 [Myxococcales bacterium]|nr:hypothetical protein [Myxococcales bacterium]
MTVSIEKVVQERWRLEHLIENNPAKGPPLESMGLVGWDKASSCFVRFGGNNLGSSSLAYSPGWEGDRFIWTIKRAAAADPLVRWMYIRSTATRMEVIWERSTDGAAWVRTRQAECTKVP